MSYPSRPGRPERPKAAPENAPSGERAAPPGGRSPVARAALPAVLVAAALTLAACSDAADSQAPGATGRAASPVPTPTWQKVTGAPRTVPAVRDFRPADGRGWRPSKGARIVVPAGEKSTVADEARLLGQDLGGMPVVWGDQPARPGDVEVKLAGKDGQGSRSGRTTRPRATPPTRCTR